MFDDLLTANERYVQTFALAGMKPRAARGFALVTCIDSRIEPLPMLGLSPGDAKIIRNAGGRVTPDVLRSLALATSTLGIDRVAVMHHTGCAVQGTEDELAAAVANATGADTAGWDFHAIADPDAALRADVEAIRDCPIIPPTVAVAGWCYDVETGRITAVL